MTHLIDYIVGNEGHEGGPYSINFFEDWEAAYEAALDHARNFFEGLEGTDEENKLFNLFSNKLDVLPYSNSGFQANWDGKEFFVKFEDGSTHTFEVCSSIELKGYYFYMDVSGYGMSVSSQIPQQMTYNWLAEQIGEAEIDIEEGDVRMAFVRIEGEEFEFELGGNEGPRDALVMSLEKLMQEWN